MRLSGELCFPEKMYRVQRKIKKIEIRNTKFSYLLVEINRNIVYFQVDHGKGRGKSKGLLFGMTRS